VGDEARIDALLDQAQPYLTFVTVNGADGDGEGDWSRQLFRVSPKSPPNGYKRLFGVPDFHYYAIADGIARLFNRCGKWCRKRQVPETAERQPELPLFASS